jgi:hypothetical protein
MHKDVDPWRISLMTFTDTWSCQQKPGNRSCPVSCAGAEVQVEWPAMEYTKEIWLAIESLENSLWPDIDGPKALEAVCMAINEAREQISGAVGEVAYELRSLTEAVEKATKSG